MLYTKKRLALLVVAALAPMAGADVWSDLAAYEYGAATDAPTALDQLVKETPPDSYAPIEAKLIEIVTSGSATEAGKSYACRMLQRVGTAKSIPALAGLLHDKVLSHYARLALQRMGSEPAAVEAMRKALPDAPDCVKPGLMGSLAECGDTAAIAAISKLIGADDAAVARTAMRSLGKLGGKTALTTLRSVKAPAALETVRLEALIDCAAAVGGPDGYAALAAVYGNEASDPGQRVAALTEMAKLDGAKACPIAVALIQGKPTLLRRGALRLVAMGKGAALTNGFVAALDSMAPATQAEVIELLGKRGDKTALPAVLAKLKSTDEAIRKAAAAAVGELGGPADVPALLRAGAYDVLAGMGADGVDQALVGALSDDATKAAALTALGRRGAQSAGAAAVKLAADPNAEVRKAAWGAMAELAGEQQMPALVKLFVGIPDSPERQAAQEAIRTICSDANDRDACFDAVVAGTAHADAKVKLFVLDLGPVVGTGKALSVERAAVASGDEEAGKRAVRAMANWPNAAAAADLLAQAKAGATLVEKVVALRGYITVAGRSGSDAQKVERYKAAVDLITRPEEKLLLISQLRDRADVSALRLLKTYAAEPKLNVVAGNAMIDAARRVRDRRQAAEIIELLTWLTENTQDKNVAKRAKDQINGLQGGRR